MEGGEIVGDWHFSSNHVTGELPTNRLIGLFGAAVISVTLTAGRI